MTPHNYARIGIAAARYLEALERDDEATLNSLWVQAENDADLLNAFREIHAGLLDEDGEHSANEVRSDLANAVETHMPSAEIVRPVSDPVTVADVASELFRHTPSGLPAEAHQLNERLRSEKDALPENLGLPSFIAWAEAKYGPAPAEYWKAFNQAARRVRMLVSADVEFQLAARRTKPRPGGPS